MTKQIDDLLAEADKIEDKASELALKEFKKIAQKILSEHDELKECWLAMGGCVFSVAGDARETVLALEDRDYFKPLTEFLDKYDERLKLTGEGIRFAAKGKAVKTW